MLYGIYSSLSSKSTLPKVTIGMPVYNGEKFLQKRLDSLLLQTFTDFELIISDDGSTDSTRIICEEYARKDERIRYIRQEKNMGPIWNFNFVLMKAKSKYFTWAAQDDVTLPKYLEKNIHILESDKNIVGSISKMTIFEMPTDDLQGNKIDIIFKNFIKKLSSLVKSLDICPINGSYAKKVRIILKKTSGQLIYAVFRTSELQKSYPKENIPGSEWILFLNLLKYGDIHAIDEVLMHRYDYGFSNKGIIKNVNLYDSNFLMMVFPFFPFTIWCMKNLGPKIFFKNFDYFIQLNLEGEVSLLIDLTRIFVHFISRR